MARRKRDQSRLLLEGRIPGAWLLGVIAAFLFMFVVGVIAYSSLNRIDTCSVCHVIKPEVATYKQSVHYKAGVGCQKCHTKPGVFNYLIRNLQGTGNLILYASNRYEKPITTFVGSNNCVQCHPKSQIERDQVVGNIRVNHKGLREAGYQCITCHADISHPGTELEVARISQNKMAICARCHDGKTLPADCSTCHVGGAPAEEIHFTIKGHVSPQQCKGCHEDKVFCRKCHNGLQMPHAPRWKQVHGKVVVDRGAKICASCHTDKDKTFCIDCHGMQMPHPGGWGTNHGTYALNNSRKCVKCHGQDSCIKCHGLQMPHPGGWLGSHGATAKTSRGLCDKCHSSSFCVDCHGVELPHGSAFIYDHPNHVYSQGSVCMKCHGNGGTGPKGCYGGQCHSGSVKF